MIRVHDIRHSAVSLLIDMGFSVLAIGERMGMKRRKSLTATPTYSLRCRRKWRKKLEMERMTKEDANWKEHLIIKGGGAIIQ